MLLLTTQKMAQQFLLLFEIVVIIIDDQTPWLTIEEVLQTQQMFKRSFITILSSHSRATTLTQLSKLRSLINLQIPEDICRNWHRSTHPTLDKIYSGNLNEPESQPVELGPPPKYKALPEPVEEIATSRVLICRRKGSDNPSHCIALRGQHLFFELIMKIRMKNCHQALENIQFERHACEIIYKNGHEQPFHHSLKDLKSILSAACSEQNYSCYIVHSLTVRHFLMPTGIKY